MTLQQQQNDMMRALLESIAAPRSEPLNSIVVYTTRADRSETATELRQSCREVLAACPALPAPDMMRAIEEYVPGQWFDARTIEEMQAFYLSRIPAIREAAKVHGYAIGLHGSTRRDLDLIAMQWREAASSKDELAHAIAVAACGITREGDYQWESKPSGRFAVSIPICCTDHSNPDFDGKLSIGHIDLSVLAAQAKKDDEIVLPQMPKASYRHPKLGDMFDRMQMHTYAMSHASWLAKLMGAAALPAPGEDEPIGEYRTSRGEHEGDWGSVVWSKGLPANGTKLYARAALPASAPEKLACPGCIGAQCSDCNGKGYTWDGGEPASADDELDHAGNMLRVQAALGMTDTGWLSPDAIEQRIRMAMRGDFINRIASAPPAAGSDFYSWAEKAGYKTDVPHEALKEAFEGGKKARNAPNCGACPGDGSICATACKVAAEAPPAAGEVASVESDEFWHELDSLFLMTSYSDRAARVWKFLIPFIDAHCAKLVAAAKQYGWDQCAKLNQEINRMKDAEAARAEPQGDKSK